MPDEFTSNGTLVRSEYDVSQDYKHVTTWQRQCKIDDVRVPVCLGLSFPLLFALAISLWKRSKDHLALGWRRTTIGLLILFGGFMFLACIFWWQGCHNFAKGATKSDGTTELRDVTFTGSLKREEECESG